MQIRITKELLDLCRTAEYNPDVKTIVVDGANHHVDCINGHLAIVLRDCIPVSAELAELLLSADTAANANGTVSTPEHTSVQLRMGNRGLELERH